MNKLSALALGTALTLSMPLAALAQDAGVDAGVGAEVGVDAGGDAGVDAGVDAGADAGVSTDDAAAGADAGASADMGAETSSYTYGDLDAALQGAAAADLSTVTADTEIEIVTVSSLSDEGEFTADAFSSDRAGFEADISTLQTSVEGNADVTAALEAEGYAADDVVAVWSQADGSLTVFVDDEGDAGMSTEGGAAGEAGAAAGPDAEAPAGEATPEPAPEADEAAPAAQ